jgi:hypothetical protein
MPRKKPEQLKSAGATTTPAAKSVGAPTTPAAKSVGAPTTAAPAAPVVPPVATPAATTVTGFHEADTNGDGIVSDAEHQMYMEFKRKEFEDADAMRDAQRSMAWFALAGMLLYPFAVVIAVFFSLDQAATVLGSMAATYFVSVAAIVAAFFGGQAYAGKPKAGKSR